MVSSFFFFVKQKTAYEMRISDWSSDVCSSDLISRFNADAFPFLGNNFLKFGSWLVAFPQEISVEWIVIYLMMSPPSSSFRFSPPQIGRASCRERVCQYV